jgi:hypothetical protein
MDVHMHRQAIAMPTQPQTNFDLRGSYEKKKIDTHAQH